MSREVLCIAQTSIWKRQNIFNFICVLRIKENNKNVQFVKQELQKLTENLSYEGSVWERKEETKKERKNERNKENKGDYIYIALQPIYKKQFEIQNFSRIIKKEKKRFCFHVHQPSKKIKGNRT
jgi:hypothetical protein